VPYSLSRDPAWTKLDIFNSAACPGRWQTARTESVGLGHLGQPCQRPWTSSAASAILTIIDNRQKLCTLLAKGFNAYMERPWPLSAPKGGLRSSPKDRKGIVAFGRPATPWPISTPTATGVELNLAWGIPKSWPPVWAGVPARRFPGKPAKRLLQHHLRSKGLPHQDGVFQPPDGFNHCHETLIKTARIKATAPT